MQKHNYSITLMLFVTVFSIHQTVQGYNSHPPRLTVVLVVDQLAHHYINKLMPNLKHGLRYLFDNGVVYTNAHMPHGQPSTATGHAGLGTGTCANAHGFVTNAWFENGKKVACDDDSSPDTFVFSPDGMCTYGKSAQRLMVDGLSDQCVLQSKPGSKFTAYSISGKSRSAIATASKLGKALWFDPQTGVFTSSKAYFDKLPEWVKKFNSNNDLNTKGSMLWEPMYPQSPYAYNFFNINNYDYTRAAPMVNKAWPVCDEEYPQQKYHWFEQMPQGNQYILDCAQSCIKNHVSRKHRDRLLLWVCLSPLDKIGHKYGPESMEAIDMIYHLDRQIRRFIRQTLRVIGKHEVIFALTADHGVMPNPEMLAEQGLTQARRLDRVELINNINKKIKEKHKLDQIVTGFKCQELLINESALQQLDSQKHTDVMKDIKFYALQEPGIANVWLYDDFIHLPMQPNSIEENIKNQLFKGRSGSVIIKTEPYVMVTHWKEGTEHKTPYSYDTHVPLVILHPGKFEKRYVRKRVSALQLPNTLAEVLNIPKPSASTCDILPDLFDPEYQ